MSSSLPNLWKKAQPGLLAGLFAALVLIAISLVVRWAAGIGTLPELLGDRIAPMLGLHLFFMMISFFSGYVHLKEFGIGSMLFNELVAGLVLGLVYVWLQQLAPAKARQRLSAIVAVLFMALIIFLWGNLSASYIGLPPSSARAASIVGLAVSAIAFTAALVWSYQLLTTPSETPQADTRRRALVLGGGSAALTLFSVGVLAYFYRISSYSYDGTVNAGADLPPVTPNDKFYSVTKNNVDPMPTASAWGLEVRGAVQHSMKLALADIRQLPSQQQQATLQCISNPVGGTLSSNAVWTGVPLHEILTRAGMSPNTKQIMLHGADGFVDTIPIDAALHPYTILAHQMNGTEIPEKHGYPVRLIVPGYVGEKSVKWITGIEARETPGEGFYEKQGWGPGFVIENASRFDAPEDGDDAPVNKPLLLKGTAFAGDRGVRAVQVSTDDGDTWQTTELTYPGTKLTWAQWQYTWTPTKPGDASLKVRCIDNLGAIQSGMDRGVGVPGQVSGFHEIDLKVKA